LISITIDINKERRAMSTKFTAEELSAKPKDASSFTITANQEFARHLDFENTVDFANAAVGAAKGRVARTARAIAGVTMRGIAVLLRCVVP